MNNTTEYWTKKLASYKESKWSEGPNIFAEQAEKYFPRNARILELGAGVGQDGRWFAEQGHSVVQTDFADYGYVKDGNASVEWRQFDLLAEWPFGDGEFDVVYSHLSLHYFGSTDMSRIMQNIHRSLKKDGVVALLTNSVSDSEVTEGAEIEPGYREIGGIKKRFFSRKTLAPFTKGFLPILFDECGETYKDREIGNSSLVRYIGTKWYSDYLNALPFVGAIVEKDIAGEKHVLIQTRWMPAQDPIYSGMLEIPAGVLDSGYENIFDVVRREVAEETGLTVGQIKGEELSKTITVGDDKVLLFESYAQEQVIKGQRPYVGSVFICTADGELKHQDEETRDPRWMRVSEVLRMLKQTPEKFFPLQVPALMKYCEENAI